MHTSSDVGIQTRGVLGSLHENATVDDARSGTRRMHEAEGCSGTPILPTGPTPPSQLAVTNLMSRHT